MSQRFEILAALLLLVVQTYSQQFNTYDLSGGSPRPLPPIIPGAIPLGPVERPRPAFRPLPRRIQAQGEDQPQPQAALPTRVKVKRPYQVRGGRISPLEPEPQQQNFQQQQQSSPIPVSPSPFPQRPFSQDGFEGPRPVTEEVTVDGPGNQAIELTLPPVTVTQRLPTAPFRTGRPQPPPSLPVFRPTSAFSPTPFIQQEEDEDFVPSKTFKQAQTNLNEGGPQLPPQRKTQFRAQSTVRQQASKAPQYEKPARPQPTATAERNDIDRAGYREKKPVAQILKRYREDNPDGSITWGFENDDGSFKEEIIGVDCVTRGKYGYIDPEGNRREYSYTSGIPCNQHKEQEEEASNHKGYIDYTNNRYVMPNGDTVDLSSMVKNRARKPVKQQYS